MNVVKNLNALSQEALDQRAQNIQAADARLAQAKVSVKRAKLDLDYSVVKSPIDGKVGRRQVSVGNLVQAGGSELASIVAIEPLYFNFELNERNALRYQSLLAQDAESKTVTVSLSDSGINPFVASFDFMDIEADRSTGTIAARVVLKEGADKIKPGMFGRVVLPLSQPKEVFLVPDTLIGSNQSLKTLMVVNEKNQVTIKPVVVGGLKDGKRIVFSGITNDEKIISAGIQKLRPGMPVTPQFQNTEGQVESTEHLSVEE